MGTPASDEFDQRDVLKSPPILEALLEIRCNCDSPFGLIPGALFHEIKETLPVHEQLPATMLTGMPLDENTKWLVHHRFKSVDNKRMVQVGPHVFTVNILGPYTRYEDFERLIIASLSAYKKVAGPSSVTRVGLRFINLIPMEVATKYKPPLVIEAKYPEMELGKWKSVVTRTVFDYPEIQSSLSLTVGFPHTVGTAAGVPATGLYLDFDVYNDAPHSSEIMEYVPWARSANMKIYKAFKSILSPELYAFLKEK